MIVRLHYVHNSKGSTGLDIVNKFPLCVVTDIFGESDRRPVPNHRYRGLPNLLEKWTKDPTGSRQGSLRQGPR